jgi:amidohydrolase
MTMTRCIHDVDSATIDWAECLRQEFHRHPELAFNEHHTATIIAEALRSLGLDAVHEGVAGTGVIGVLRGASPGKTVALRADMDALAIQEETGLPYASLQPGLMHACGHDGHSAALLGAARLLTQQRSELAGAVKFIFQPAEEEGAGAKLLVAAGVLRDEPPIEAIFALHGRSEVPLGSIELDPIPSAATNPFDVRVQGMESHGAYPHCGIDPIPIAAHIVTALQQVVSRRVAPYESAVVTIGSFHAGAQRNVIPREAVLQGTIRTRDPAVQTRVVEEVRRITTGTAAAFGTQAEVQFLEGYPRVKNDPTLMEFVRTVGHEVLGPDNVLDAHEQTMGGEDFAYYLTEQGGVPGCLFKLGLGCKAQLHTAQFDFGKPALPYGMLMLANLARRYCG